MTTFYKTPAFVTLTTGAALAAAVFFAGAAQADQKETDAQIEPSVSFAKATEVAAATGQGDIVALELDHHSSRPVYVAEMESETSHTILHIDGATGEVLATATVSAKNQEEKHAMLYELDHEGHDEHDDHDDHDDDDD